MEREPPELPQIVTYYSFSEVQRAADNLPAPWIKISVNDDAVTVAIVEESTLKIEVTVHPDFLATVKVLQGFSVAKTYNLENMTLRTLLSTLSAQSICEGVTVESLQDFAKPVIAEGQLYFRHLLYTSLDACTSTVRSRKCDLLIDTGAICESCRYAQTLLRKKEDRAKKSKVAPMKANNPLKMGREALKDALKEKRKHSRSVEQNLRKFRQTLESECESVKVNDAMHDSLKSVIDQQVSSLNNPMTRLFWEEQVKAFQCKGKQGMRWHPMMIRLAILLHSRSPAAYDTLRQTGVLRLPGDSTLQDYTNVFRPSVGFTKATLDAVKEATKGFADNQRFVALLHDEMTIKADVVFDQR